MVYLKIKRKCVYCDQIKLIAFHKNPPVCEECFTKIQHDRHYVIKLVILLAIIVLIFIASIFIQ